MKNWFCKRCRTCFSCILIWSFFFISMYLYLFISIYLLYVYIYVSYFFILCIFYFLYLCIVYLFISIYRLFVYIYVSSIFIFFGSLQAQIENALDMICGLLPSTISETCTSFVAQYTKEIIFLITQSVSPKQVCAALTLCTTVESGKNYESVRISM